MLRVRAHSLFVGVVLCWVMQLGLDFASNFLGGGLTIIGDIVLGGIQVWLAWSLVALVQFAARKPGKLE